MSRLGLPDGIRACLFDLDGVLTDTAAVHRAAWREVFDALLAARGLPPFTDEDYLRYVDGRQRRDGVRDFLASRAIVLNEGSPRDPPEADTVAGVGNRKNVLLLDRLAREGVEVIPGSTDYLRAVRAAGIRTAVVTSSANGEAVIRAAGLEDLVEVRVDGVVAQQEGLPGKPAPDTFLAAARRLGVQPASAAVFEDALAGVAAGRAGGFGFVVGVDRGDQADALRANGADVVVERPRGSSGCVVTGTVGRPTARLGVGSRSSRGTCAPPASTRRTWRCRSRSSPCRTGTSGCAATSTRASRTALPGTYLNGFYEERPLPYAEGGYGYPESGQTLINVTDGKLIRLLVDDEPFDVRYGTAAAPRAGARPPRRGAAARTVEWTSPAGQAVRVRSTRLVSFTQRAVAAIHYEVEAGRRRGPHRRAVRPASPTSPCPSSATTRASRPPLARAAGRARSTLPGQPGRCWCTARGAAGCGWRPAMDHLSTVPGRRG